MDEKELFELIKYFNREYRKGTPEISDREYDNLVESLRKINPKHEWFQHIEPVEVASSRKVKLSVPMKSLKKVKTVEDIDNWIDSMGLGSDDWLVVTPKFDGLSLLYNEVTERAYSRGGSENEGQDCTNHIVYADIPTCAWTKLHYTYGEFVFTKESWKKNFADKISPETNEKYRSARSTAAGLLNRIEPSDDLKYVDFFRYGTDEKSMKQFKTYLELYEYLCREYSQKPLYAVTQVKNINEKLLKDYFNQWNSVYFCDGLVLYANDLEVWKRVGRQKTTGNPNYAMAYKSKEFTDVFETKVKRVTWRVSKAGYLKPVVEIEAVDNGDCTIDSPNGYNARYIRNNKIAPGAKISITRSGGVIPKIVETTRPASEENIQKQWKKLEKCPTCGKPTEWNETGSELCCTNPNCKGRTISTIVYFYQTLGASTFGEKKITLLYEAGFNTLKRMLHVSFDDLLRIDGIGESHANTLLYLNSEILRGVPAPRLMAASNCFDNFSETRAKAVLSQMTEGELWAFVNGLMNIAPEYFRTRSFKANLCIKKTFYRGIESFYKFVAENGLKILPIVDTVQVTSKKFDKFKVCFSGIRDKVLENDIIAGGGEVMSNVTKDTTHLIVKDLSSTSTKTLRAKKYKVPIVTLEEFDRYR